MRFLGLSRLPDEGDPSVRSNRNPGVKSNLIKQLGIGAVAPHLLVYHETLVEAFANQRHQFDSN